MVALKLLSRLPLPVLYVLADVLYPLLYYGVRVRRQTVYTNLCNSVPTKTEREITRLAKAFYRNYSDVLVEMVKGISIDQQELDKRVSIVNRQVLEEFLNRQQSVLVLLAHKCNLEWLTMASCLKLSHPLDAIYKPFHNQSINQLMYESRSRFGGRLIPARSALVEMVRSKNEVRGFAIAPDQTPRESDEKHWTRFLNQDTAFFVGVEKIARLTRYPVVFMGVKRIKRGYYEGHIRTLATPPYEGEGNLITELYAREVEKEIQADPADWLWSHRRWKYKKPLYS